jgi:hypothetical protein
MPAQKEEISETEEAKPVVVRQEPERDLAVWTAPARPFKKRNRTFYITLIAIAGLVGLILFLVEGFMPVVLIIALIFLFYVLSTVEPEKIEYKISNRGIKVADKRTDFNQCIRFWFTKRFDNELLVVEIITIPGRLELVINPVDKEQIRKSLLVYLPEEQASPSFLDRASDWFAKKLPQG